MAKVKVEVEVSKESFELVKGLAKVIEAVLLAKKDGWQWGEDLPAVAVAAFGQMSAIEGIDQIKAEMEADPAAFAKALGLGIADIYDVIKSDEDAEEPATAE